MGIMLYNDINLIPSKRSGTTPARVVIGLLSVILVLSLVNVFLVYEPLKEKRLKEDRLNSLNSVVAGYGDIATEYMNARDEYERYTAKTANLKAILKEDFSATDEIQAFALVCPEGLKIRSYAMTDGNLTIGCYADTYEIIGHYIDILKEVDYFEDIAYSTIIHVTEMVEDPEGEPVVRTTESGEEISEIPLIEKEGYTFTLNVKVKKKL
jgi:hypothetical protein